MSRPALEGRRWRIRGTVQGVGFRPFVQRLACQEDVAGSVRNDDSGVVVDAFGEPERLARLRARIEREAPGSSSIRRVYEEITSAPARPARGFAILPSVFGACRRPAIPPDLATCDACLRELRDPADRRHRHPFANCTACGPRYSIAREAPYDRSRTTMARFSMCPACRGEYEDPRDRRFHAQPIACPACGPRLALLDASGASLDAPDPIEAAARALAAGRIVALRGIGGFHLACDATASEPVKRLRERKRREAKPFAVMLADLAAARQLARIGEVEARLLASPERPIALLRALDPAALAPEVAPGLPYLGLLLPYTPLHHLLCEAAGRPLVMTSGNLSEEPIATDVDEALRRLGGIADLFLVHDREIAAPCEDSVARVVAGVPTLLRRARGFVPRPVAVERPFAEPVLACGAQLKSAICLGVGDLAYLGPHIGDLETPESVELFAESVERMERFVGVRAEVVAHDLHPDYASTRYALARGARLRIAVQHHHAHLASALAEHGVRGPALGLAWDGTGYGHDGSAWGGELLRVDGARAQRLASFRPILLAGGERAIREPWRQALALLEDAFDGDAPFELLPLFERVPAERFRAVRGLLHRGVRCTPAHGVGRSFDALGALLLERPLARYEGEVALALEALADPNERGCYPFVLRDEGGWPWQVDLRPAVRTAVGELVRRVPAPIVAARFHETLACIAEALVQRARREVGDLPLALSGGCFQNARLTGRICQRLGDRARLIRHREVPPNDGGIALGQAVVAGAHLAEEDATCA